MTAVLPRSRAYARVARLEAHAVAVRQAVDPRVAAVRWTERFQRHHPDLIQRVFDRAKTSRTMLLDPSPSGCMPHAGFMWMYLMYEIPHLWVDENPTYGNLPPMEPVVPDPEDAAALFREFMITAAFYQADHHDLFPLFGYRLQEVGKMAFEMRRAEREEAQAAVREGSASDCNLRRSTEKTPASTGVGEGA